MSPQITNRGTNKYFRKIFIWTVHNDDDDGNVNDNDVDKKLLELKCTRQQWEYYLKWKYLLKLLLLRFELLPQLNVDSKCVGCCKQ